MCKAQVGDHFRNSATPILVKLVLDVTNNCFTSGVNRTTWSISIADASPTFFELFELFCRGINLASRQGSFFQLVLHSDMDFVECWVFKSKEGNHYTLNFRLQTILHAVSTQPFEMICTPKQQRIRAFEMCSQIDRNGNAWAEISKKRITTPLELEVFLLHRYDDAQKSLKPLLFPSFETKGNYIQSISKLAWSCRHWFFRCVVTNVPVTF